MPNVARLSASAKPVDGVGARLALARKRIPYGSGANPDSPHAGSPYRIRALESQADQEIATGGTRPENLLLATPQYLSRNKLDVRLSSAARVIDPSRHTVVDQSGGVYRYGKLLSRPALPCRLPFPADLDESPERPSLNYGTLNKIGEVTLGVI